MNKEISVEQAREKFIIKLWQVLDYWEKVPGKTKREAMEGFMHTFLASGLDGCGLDLPPMEVKPIVSDEDKRYFIENEESYFPTEDIAGGLHEVMFSIGRKYGYKKD